MYTQDLTTNGFQSRPGLQFRPQVISHLGTSQAQRCFTADGARTSAANMARQSETQGATALHGVQETLCTRRLEQQTVTGVRLYKIRPYGVIRPITGLPQPATSPGAVSCIEPLHASQGPQLTIIAELARSVRRLLVTASVVPCSPILVTQMKEALSFSETSVLTKATRR
jgi:hypothetical protein